MSNLRVIVRFILEVYTCKALVYSSTSREIISSRTEFKLSEIETVIIKVTLKLALHFYVQDSTKTLLDLMNYIYRESNIILIVIYMHFLGKKLKLILEIKG